MNLPKGHQAVESSNISSVKFHNIDLTKCGTMEVLFKNGDLWEYRNVPRELFTGLMESESKGRYLNMNIKASADLYEPVRLGKVQENGEVKP